MSQVKQAERKKKNIHPSLPFCSTGAVSGLAEAHARGGGPASVLSPPIQKAHLFQKHHHRHTQKCLTTSEHPVAQLSTHFEHNPGVCNGLSVGLRVRTATANVKTGEEGRVSVYTQDPRCHTSASASSSLAQAYWMLCPFSRCSDCGPKRLSGVPRAMWQMKSGQGTRSKDLWHLVPLSSLHAASGG